MFYIYEQFDLLEVLHPTPAVCGHPQAPAREAITASGMIFLPHSTTDPEKFKVSLPDGWNLIFWQDLRSPSLIGICCF